MLPDLLVCPVVKEVLTAPLEVTETVVTMPTERRTKLPLESSDLDSVVLDEVPLEQSKRMPRNTIKGKTKRKGSKATPDCTSEDRRRRAGCP